MKNHCKRVFALLLTLCMALSTMPLTAAAVGGSGGSSTVPTSIEKVVITAVATKWPDGEPKPAEITLTTANVFLIGNNGQPNAARVMFEIRGLTQNNIWKYDMGERIGSALYVPDDGVAQIAEYREMVTAGKCSYSIRIYNYQETISYALEVKTYIAPGESIPATIPSLNPKPELEYWDTLCVRFDVKLPKGSDYTDLRGELVAADGSDVYAVTKPSESARVSDRTQPDTRYDAIFENTNIILVQCSRASLNFYCGKPLVVGNYDVKLYRGQTLVATVPNAMRATKDPILNLRSTEDYYQTGETAVYANLYLSGGTLSDLNVSLWKNGSLLATAGAPRVVSADNESSEGNFVIAVPGGLQSEGSYELKITRKSGKPLEGQTSVSIHTNSDMQNLAIQQATYSNASYANFIVKAARVDPNTTYRVELANENTPLATIETKPSADGVFDLEFLSATGALILLNNNQSYSMDFSIWNEQQHRWRTCGNAYVFTNFQTEMGSAAALAAVESYPLGVMWANGRFSSETVKVNIGTADMENLSRLSDNSKFQLRMTSVLGINTDVNLTVTRTGEGNTAFVNMSAPVPANTPHGYYNFELLYEGVPVIKPGSLATNILTNNYPSEYSDKLYSGIMGNTVGKNDIGTGVHCETAQNAKPDSVQVAFYRFGNFTATPDKTVSKTLSSEANAFTAADLSGLNLAVKYDIVLYRDGKPVNVRQTGYLGDERPWWETPLLPHRVTATQPANGTLELLPCGGGTADAVPGWTEVYVQSTPSPGYQLKPNSVKVNGQSIYGRAFLVTDENCTVTAEFEPAPAKKYQVTAPGNITGGYIILNSSNVAAGERVSFDAQAYNGYDILRVYYTSNGTQFDLSKSDDGKYHFTMPANDVVVGAEFRAKQSYNITLNPTDNGTLTVENAQAWQGDYILLRTVPGAGYHLESLTVTSDGITLQLIGQTKDGCGFQMPANEVIVTATFAPGIGIELLPWSSEASHIIVDGLEAPATLVVATYNNQGKMTAVAMAHLTKPVRWLEIPIGTFNGSTKLFLFSSTGELTPLKFSKVSLL